MTQDRINQFADENLPAESPRQRAKALRQLMRIIEQDEHRSHIQRIRNLKLVQLLEQSAEDIESHPIKQL